MLYKYNIWAGPGKQLAYVRYFNIDADEDTIKEIQKELNPRNVDELISHLVNNRKISVEEVRPVILDIYE